MTRVIDECAVEQDMDEDGFYICDYGVASDPGS